MSARICDARRGSADDELELTDEQGFVTILHGHGVGIDEQRRTRERALQLLAASGIKVVTE